MLVKIGNLFETKCEVLVNTVNCVGVMGKGIALDFKKRYPDMYTDYINRCNNNEIKPGEPYIYQCQDGTKILNFPTKVHWRSPAKLSYVIDGLNWFIENYKNYEIKSIAFPPLGCGNGGLTWDIIGPVMYQMLDTLPITIEIYAPYGTQTKELSDKFLSKPITSENIVGNNLTRMNNKWYLILQIIRELNQRRYALKVGRTIYQKICYVLTRNGVDTGFRFVKGTYGPYSTQVKDSITALANANMIIEKTLGRMVSIEVNNDVEINEGNYSDREWEAMQKTVDLFGRIKNTEQAETITTVMFAYDQLTQKGNPVSDKDIYDYVLNWKPYWQNNKENKEYELIDAIQNMAMLSQINITCSKQLMDTSLTY